MNVIAASALLLAATIAPAAMPADITYVLPRSEQLVQTIPLQAYFHTKQAWRLEIYEQPHAMSLARTGMAKPMNICFTYPPAPGVQPTSCWVIHFLRLDSVKLVQVRGPYGKLDRPLVVIRAVATNGGGTIHDITYGFMAFQHSAGIGFIRAVHSTVNISGEQKLVETGPLAGAFVELVEVMEGNEKSMASPRHYQMSVYEPVRFGYQKVLTVLSKRRYSSPIANSVPHPLATLTPEIVHDLSAVYPHGVYARAVQR